MFYGVLQVEYVELPLHNVWSHCQLRKTSVKHVIPDSGPGVAAFVKLEHVNLRNFEFARVQSSVCRCPWRHADVIWSHSLGGTPDARFSTLSFVALFVDAGLQDYDSVMFGAEVWSGACV